MIAQAQTDADQRLACRYALVGESVRAKLSTKEKKAIAEDLNLSLKTVQAYCARAKEKFGVTSMTELLRAAIRWEEASHVK